MTDPSPEPPASTRPGRTRGTRLRRLGASITDSFPQIHRVNAAVVAAVVAVAAGIQWAMLRPPYPSDSMSYFKWAERLGHNQIHHGPTRLGVVLPVRLAQEIFGTSEAAYYVVPFLMTLLLIGAVYVLGTQIAGNGAGLVAAVTMAGSTLVLKLSSQIVPDPFAAAWFVFGLVCFFAARSSPRRTWWLTAGAVAIGLAYLCRAYTVFLAPVLLFVGWTTGWRRRDWIRLGAVLVATLGIEMILMVVLFDDPLARFRALAGFAERGTTGESTRLVAYGEGASLWTVLTRSPITFAHYAVGILLLLSALAGIALAILNRPRRWLWSMLVLWVASLWVPMMVLAGIFDPQHPHIRDNRIRYWYLVIPALYLLLGAVSMATVRAMRIRGIRWVAGVLVGILLVGAVAYDLHNEPPGTEFRAFGATQWDEVRDWLRRDGDTISRIYTDSRMAMVLPLYTNEVFGGSIWDGEIVVFEHNSEFLPTGEMDGAILLHELGLTYLGNRDLTVPADYFDPGPGWLTAVRRGDGTLTIVVPRHP